jgi:hypothetical protein
VDNADAGRAGQPDANVELVAYLERCGIFAEIALEHDHVSWRKFGEVGGNERSNI